MNSRRQFLRAAGAAGALLPYAVRGARTAELSYPEVEARIARRDFKGLTKEDLGTPALIENEGRRAQIFFGQALEVTARNASLNFRVAEFSGSGPPSRVRQ